MASSDLIVQLSNYLRILSAAFIGVVLLGVLTYVYNFRETKSPKDDDKFLQIESKETKKEKVERAKKAEAKDKKKPKPAKTVAATTPGEVVAAPESPVANKSKKSAEPKAETPKASKAKKSTKTSAPVEVAVVVAEEMALEEDGWTKVIDKKQKNKQVEVSKKAAKAEKTKVEPKPAPVPVVAPVVDEDNSWTTVTDKKQKKSSSSAPPQQNPAVVEPTPVVAVSSPESKSKKSKSKKSAAVVEEIPVKVPEPTPVPVEVKAPVPVESKKSKKSKAKTPEPTAVVATPVAPVVDKVETAVVEEEGEWITANSKVIKKSKDKAKALKEEPVKETTPAAVVAESPKSSNKKNKKNKEVAAAPVTSSTTTAPVVEAVPEPTPAKTLQEIPQAIHELMKTAGSNPVAAAIIEQFKNDSNNNLIQTIKPTTSAVVVDSEAKTKTKKDKSQANSKVVEQVLKSTNLTESMILIDTTEPKSGSSRTNSQPSSSESLQDLDVGEGWATITSKKKRTVRREA